MDLIDVDDITMPELNIYHQLRENAFTEDNSFIADSPKVVNLLLETDITINSILATQEYYDSYGHLMSDKNIPKATLYFDDSRIAKPLSQIDVEKHLAISPFMKDHLKEALHRVVGDIRDPYLAAKNIQNFLQATLNITFM